MSTKSFSAVSSTIQTSIAVIKFESDQFTVSLDIVVSRGLLGDKVRAVDATIKINYCHKHKSKKIQWTTATVEVKRIFT
jgi:hypothetical protein